MTKLFKAFPNWHETIEDIIAEGDKVYVRLRIVNGKVVGQWSVYDVDFLRQMGMIEPTEKGKKLFPKDVK